MQFVFWVWGLSWTQGVAKLGQVRPRWGKLDKVGAKLDQVGPILDQLGFRMWQMVEVRFVQQKRMPNSPRQLILASERSRVEATLRQVGRNWGQIGASWSQVGRSWANIKTRTLDESQNGRQQNRKWSQEGPKPISARALLRHGGGVATAPGEPF